MHRRFPFCAGMRLLASFNSRDRCDCGATNAHVDRAGMGVDGSVLGVDAGGTGTNGVFMAYWH